VLPSLTDAEEGLGRQNEILALKTRTLRNTLLVLAGRTASRGIAVVTILLTATHLHAERFGEFSVAIVSTTLVASICLDLGFNTLLQREGAARPAEIERYLQNLLSVRLIFGVITLPVLAAVLYVLRLENLLAPAFLLTVFMSISTLLRYALYAVQRIGFEVAAIVTESVLILGLTLVGVHSHQGVSYFLWANAGAYAFDCIYFLVALRVLRIARIRWRFEPELIRKWIWMGVPLALTAVLTTMFWKADVPTLKYFRGDTEVGWYSLAYKPFEALLFIPVAMFNVVMPALASVRQESPESLRAGVRSFFKALLVIGWPLSVGIWILAAPLAGLWKGAFPESIAALQILGLACVFAFTNVAFIGALTVLNRLSLLTLTASASLLFNVISNVMLIPRFGYLAASWTTVGTAVFLEVLGFWFTTRHLGPLGLWATSWRVVVAGLIMGVALYPLRDVHGVAVAGAMTLGLCIYAGSALALRAITAEEVAMLRTALLAGRPYV
jgi:O-antigen/teichoic acid export membrane protein